MNTFLYGLLDVTMGILHKCGGAWLMHLKTFKIKLNQRQWPYAMLNHIIWWPFTDAPTLYFHSIIVFKWNNFLLPSYAKTTNREVFSKNDFLFWLLNPSKWNSYLIKCHLLIVKNTLFSSNIEISSMNCRHLLQ